MEKSKRPFLNAGNWKLNKNPQETEAFLAEFLERTSEQDRESYLIFPPTTSLSQFSLKLKSAPMKWGAQNVFWESAGAYTGATSAEVVKGLGGTHCLVGHSERRTIFRETDDIVAKKVNLIQKVGLIPMICVGESALERSEGVTAEVITNQLKQALSLANLETQIIIAYEPVWAIGTGEVATPEMSEAAHVILRRELSILGGSAFAEGTQILYGGSVKAANAGDLIRKENIDGFLVGGASLNVSSFVDIFKACVASCG